MKKTKMVSLGRLRGGLSRVKDKLKSGVTSLGTKIKSKFSSDGSTDDDSKVKLPSRLGVGIRSFGNAIRGMRGRERKPYYGESDTEVRGVGKFLVFMWALHLIDWLTGFQTIKKNFSSPVPVAWIIGLYVLATVIALLVIFRGSSIASRLSGKIVFISFLAIEVPRLLEVYVSHEAWMHAILFFLPIWGLYLMFGQYSTDGTRQFGSWYLIIVLILGFYGYVTSETLNIQGSFQQANVRDSLQTIKQTFGDNTKTLFKDLMMLPSKIGAKINQSLSTDYFTGQVEQNKDAPLGVYLEDLQPTEEYFFQGTPIVVWANIRGKSFEGAISVDNKCYAKKGSSVIFGRVHPTQIDLFYDDSRTLECVFEENLEQFEEGTYSVTFSSKFTFPTWGYVTYVFVDKNTQIAYYSQKKNINQELDIPTKAESIYTNGPAAIGMNSLDLPITVYTNNPYLLTFGMTLSNAWPQGEIITIKKLEVRVPQEIYFDTCYSIQYKEPVGREDDYNIYNFEIDVNKGFFKTITCPMKMK
ncbi:MAG: hypothetical protein KKF89_02430, partial [Nanoarchaeota archaeon]|nr:hypothetical protein [Nanoarchaeota archaeon]